MCILDWNQAKRRHIYNGKESDRARTIDRLIAANVEKGRKKSYPKVWPEHNRMCKWCTKHKYKKHWLHNDIWMALKNTQTHTQNQNFNLITSIYHTHIHTLHFDPKPWIRRCRTNHEFACGCNPSWQHIPWISLDFVCVFFFYSDIFFALQSVVFQLRAACYTIHVLGIIWVVCV